jgi:hypothetical protein
MQQIRYYDVDSRQVVMIPSSELSAGAVCTTVDGIEGEVWTMPVSLHESTFKHPPFNETVRNYLEQIRTAFAEHYPLTLEEWEDGFRRDENASQQIAVWLYAAEIYKAFVSSEPSANRRGDIYRCIVSCMMAGRDSIWEIYQPHSIRLAEAEEIVSRFYTVAPSDGIQENA